MTYRNLPEQARIDFLAVLLRDDAGDWFDTLSVVTRSSWAATKEAFELRFKDSELMKWRKASDLWNRVQSPDESVDSYVTSMKKLARSVGVEGDQLRYVIQRGLRPQLLGHVIQKQPVTVDELVAAARVAEAAVKAVASATASESSLDRVVAELTANRQAAERNTEELRRFASQLVDKSISNIGGSSAPAPQRAPAPRRVTFAPEQRRTQPVGQPRQLFGRRASQTQERPRTATNCQYCGGTHWPGPQYCRAANVQCYSCGIRGHFKNLCRRGRRPPLNYLGPPNFST